MSFVFLRHFFLLACLGFILLPVQPTPAKPNPYFQLTIMAAETISYGSGSDREDLASYRFAQRLAPQLERLGIEVRVVQERSLTDHMYPGGNNPAAVPGPWKENEFEGYDLTTGHLPDETFYDLWLTMHTWATWYNDSILWGVASPQLHDEQLDRDLEALFGFHQGITSEEEALQRVLYRLTWEFQPFIPVYSISSPDLFSVATLNGLKGVISPGSPPALRWGHNGLETWSFAPDTNQSTVRLAVSPRTASGFLFYVNYEGPHERSIRVTEVALNGLLVPRDLDHDAAISTYLPDLAQRLPVPINGTSRLDGQNYTASDLRIWEVAIRSGITWHPGYGYPARPFTVDDVLFTYQTLWNHSWLGPSLARLFGPDPHKGVEAVNTTTLRFHLTALPSPAPEDGLRELEFFCEILTWPILPRHILNPTYVSPAGLGKTADGASIPTIANWTQSDFHRGYRTQNYTGPAIIGTGPYRWEGSNGSPAYEPNGTQILLTRHEGYFKDNSTTLLRTDMPTSQRPQFVTIQEFATASTAVEALLNRSIDVLWNLRVIDWNQLQTIRQRLLAEPGVEPSLDPVATFGLFVNTAHNRLTRPVRLAIAHAINREQVAQDVAQVFMNSVGAQAYANPLPLSIFHPAYPTNLTAPMYNLEKAWDYMEEAGYDMSPYRSDNASSPKTSGISLTGAGLWVAFAILVIKRRQSRQRPILHWCVLVDVSIGIPEF
ncbi:MAG: ABC transporter substrate-binding protein [Candidatus Heimdallarchaeota archaeon]